MSFEPNPYCSRPFSKQFGYWINSIVQSGFRVCIFSISTPTLVQPQAKTKLQYIARDSLFSIFLLPPKPDKQFCFCASLGQAFLLALLPQLHDGRHWADGQLVRARSLQDLLLPLNKIGHIAATQACSCSR